MCTVYMFLLQTSQGCKSIMSSNFAYNLSVVLVLECHNSKSNTTFFIRLFVFNKISFSMLPCRISVKYYPNRKKCFSLQSKFLLNLSIQLESVPFDIELKQFCGIKAIQHSNAQTITSKSLFYNNIAFNRIDSFRWREASYML